MLFDKVLSFHAIKMDKYVIQHILWDIEPKQLMEPKGTAGGGSGEIKGYVFYIETMGKKPALFLMRHTPNCAETIAQIEEIPDELLAEAVCDKTKEYFRMYPINKKIKEKIKKELGIQD